MNYKNKLKYNLIIISIIFLFFSCTNEQSKNETSEDENIATTEISSVKDIEPIKKAKVIFYNMQSPVEMAKLFQRAGAIYKPNILNPFESWEKYITNQKSALNLGIYGVDFSYIRMFNHTQNALNYLSSIKKLSSNLRIPEKRVSYTVERIEKYIENKDSLFQIAFNDFEATNMYLKKSERENTASLIILGGWVEAIYIALKILDKENPNKEIMENIAEQKYTLNNLIALISNCQNEMNVTKYILLLKKLRKVFNKIEIYYQHGDLKIDTINKTITAENKHINITIEQIKEIENVIISLRNEIIK